VTSKLHVINEEGTARGATRPPTSQSDLTPLSSIETNRLLASHHFGRLAFAYESWPVILPVNYVYDDPTIVIRTDLGAKLSATPFHAVAFEVDDAGPLGDWGWSVLAQGPAFDITEADETHCRFLRTLEVEPWAPGVHDHWLTISAVNLSGRRFGRVPELEELSSPDEYSDERGGGTS
jgi:uncharacterized protein